VKLQSYYQALKPERTYANVMTTAAGFFFASKWQLDIGLLAATLAGTTLVVLSACAVNNCTDRAIDAKMPRTRKRGTVTGQVPVRSLAILAAILGLVGFWLLLKYVNMLTFYLGVIAYIDYVICYAWSKRHTPWSTLIGTVSGAVPLVAGYTAVTNRFDMTALLLGLIMVFWQMVHFYAIAVFRREDYRAGNVPVWSLRYGNRNTQYWMIAYTVLYMAALVALVAIGSASLLFGVVIGGFGLYWLYRGFSGLNSLNEAAWARGMFGFSLVTLLVLSVALSVDSFLA
jgi:protoheme IX farnesyltransferase